MKIILAITSLLAINTVYASKRVECEKDWKDSMRQYESAVEVQNLALAQMKTDPEEAVVTYRQSQGLANYGTYLFDDILNNCSGYIDTSRVNEFKKDSEKILNKSRCGTKLASAYERFLEDFEAKKDYYETFDDHTSRMGVKNTLIPEATSIISRAKVTITKFNEIINDADSCTYAQDYKGAARSLVKDSKGLQNDLEGQRKRLQDWLDS